MKRRVWAVFAAALLLCGGCAPTVGDAAAAPTPVVQPTAAPTPEPMVVEKTVRRFLDPDWADRENIELWEVCYLYQNGDFSMIVNYPELRSEPEDGPINRIFREEALGNDLTGDEYDIRCQGYQGSVDGDWYPARIGGNMLSVRFRSQSAILGAAYPSWYEWGVTLDRKSGARLTLDDLVDTGEDFAAWLYAQDWTAWDHWQPGGGGPGNDEEYVAAQLGYYLEYREHAADHVNDFFVTEDELVIIAWDARCETRLSVPLSDLTLKGDTLWNG